MSTFRNYVNSITVPISGTLSPAFSVEGLELTGLHIPVVNSGHSLTMLVAPPGPNGTDPSSASFYPLQKSDGSGAWGLSTITGSIAIAMTPDLHAFSHAKVQLSAAQSAARTFVLSGKRS